MGDNIRGWPYSLVVKVLLDHPNPFLLAHGGFQIQIEQTKRGLEANAVEVDWLKWWDDKQKGDVIHYFGRPHPAYIRQAQAKGIKVVMSELLTGLGSRPAPARMVQKILMLLAASVLSYDFVSRLAWESYQEADAVVALTEWEKKLMNEMFCAAAHKIHVVPNGVEDVFSRPAPGSVRARHLVCVATITQRKKVLELARAAILAKVKIRIIGQPYCQTDPYFQDFLAVVNKSAGWVQYDGAISDRKRLAHEYRSAMGFVLLSSMESQSLSALEAAACGCPLLLSELPWAKATFGAEASYAPLADEEKTAGYLRKFFDRLPNVPKVNKVLLWNEVAERLAKVYRQLTIVR